MASWSGSTVRTQTRQINDTWNVVTAPKCLPLLGHALQLRRHPQDYLASLWRYGDLVEIRAGKWNAYVVCNPDLAHAVLVDDRLFDKGGRFFEKARELGGNGLVTCPHSAHRRQRRLIQPMFTQERIAEYAPIMVAETEKFLGTWRDGRQVRIQGHLYELTSRIIASAVFGGGVVGDNALAIAGTLEFIFQSVYRRTIAPLEIVNKLPTPANLRYRATSTRVRKILAEIVDDARAKGEACPELLKTLLQAMENNPGDISLQEIRDQVLAFLAGGIEAPATIISWSLYELSRHPTVRYRVQDEVDQVLAGRTAQWDDLDRMPYTDLVMNEIFRLYPPPSILSRVLTDDVRFGDRVLPAGTTLIWSPYIIQRNPDVYEDPYGFRPERWEDAAKPPPRNAIVPFGGGPRKCIGEHYGKAETKLVLTSIIARWHLSQVGDDEPLATNPGSTIPPNHLTMKIQRRAVGEHR
jgi:cytochrome P450